MTDVVRVGVRFEPDAPPEDLRAFARAVERLGYDDLWFSEDLPWAGGIAMAAVALTCTERIRVGVGLLPAVTRNVATAAMEIGALARMFPGRLAIALGTGVPVWMEQIGARTHRRFGALGETTDALRRLLAGEAVTVQGDTVSVRDVELGFPPRDVPPVLLGVTGPAGLAIAARSDGVLLPELSTPDAVRWARAEMQRTGSPGETALLAFLSVGDDREAALRPVRPRVQRLIDLQLYPRLTELTGAPMSDEVLRSLAVAGSPADCAQTIAGLAAAGAGSIILVAGSDDHEAAVERFARDVLPLTSTRSRRRR
jgi:alkanesulfonate monooxygenase SsuD/methylene tetrahydromethanopterin reductase-like flavin-dependent oxidoreductase (luciferase family)